MKSKTKALLLDIIMITLGSLVYAVSVNVFTLPNLIAPGGATGLATVIYHFTSFPVGIITIVINIPLFILAWKIWGFKTLLRTFSAMVVLSLMTDATAPFLPMYTDDILLAAIFGGVTGGLGLGLIYTRGITTGGSDLLAQILYRKTSSVSYGSMLIAIDATVVIIAAIAFRDINSMFYAAITIYIVGKIVDKILDGLDSAKLVQIVSEKTEEISAEIIEKMNRGATFIKARGAYTGEDKNMLYIVVKRYELHRLKQIVRNADSRAFIIIGDVTEVLGEGFKEYET